MATKQISELDTTTTASNTDQLMIRQSSQDYKVSVEVLRNIGTETGSTMAVGTLGYGGNAILITDLFASNNASLITQSGIYQVNGCDNCPVSVGEITHTQTDTYTATQTVKGADGYSYFRTKTAGTWSEWVVDSVPAGGIIMYTGSTAPTGWAFCDGTNGTPDLTDRFIIGAGNTYSVDDTGGTTSKTTESSGSHTHTITVDDHTLTIDEIPSHTHSFNRYTGDGATGLGTGASNNQTSDGVTDSTGGGEGHNHTASSASAGSHTHTISDIKPPYYALAFIMKLAV